MSRQAAKKVARSRNGLARSAAPAAPAADAVQHRRQLLADLCRLLGRRVNGSREPGNRRGTIPLPAKLPSLSPRMRQTLERLLAGDSEKQIARRLGLSRHTVHVYVKALYRGFDVSSRGELLALFINLPELNHPSTSR